MSQLLRDYDEEALVRWLFTDPSLIFSSFSFMFHEACGFNLADWELDFWFSVKRQALGLSAQGKPGDIDVLVVPKFRSDRFVERSMAIEVKRLFAPREKRQKSPNSFGASQVKGLFTDGFPFAGLMHLVLAEASHDHDLFPIPIIIGVNRHGEYVHGETVQIDPAGFDVAVRHSGRLSKIDLPYFSGYNVQMFQLSAEGERFTSMSVNENRAPMRNPDCSENLLRALKRFDVEPDCSVRFTYGRVDIRHKPYFDEADNLMPLIDDPGATVSSFTPATKN